MKRKDGGVRKEGRDVVCVVAPDLMCRRAAVRTHFLGVALTDGARFSGSSPDLWPHMHSASGPFRSTGMNTVSPASLCCDRSPMPARLRRRMPLGSDTILPEDRVTGVQAVGELIKAGKIRYWGLSNETAYGVTMMCETAKRLGVPLPITMENDYSLCDRCEPACNPALQYMLQRLCLRPRGACR